MEFWVNFFFLSLGETLKQRIARKNAWALFWFSLYDFVTSVLYFSVITPVYTELSCSPTRDIKNYKTISHSLSAIARFDFKVTKSILIILWWENSLCFYSDTHLLLTWESIRTSLCLGSPVAQYFSFIWRICDPTNTCTILRRLFAVIWPWEEYFHH